MARNDRIPPFIVDPDVAYRVGFNMATETFDRRLGNNGATFGISGQVRAGAATILEGDTLNTLYAFSSGAGTAVTAFQAVVYDRDFRLVANSADVKAALGAGVWVPAPLSSSWTATYSGIVYLGLFCTFTTTSPTYATSPVTMSAAIGGPPVGSAWAAWQQNNATIPATATPASATTVPYLMAV